MSNTERTFEHAAAIESLADTLMQAGSPVEPDELFAFLQMPAATLTLLQRVIIKVHAQGWNSGAEETEARLLDSPQQSPN